MTFMSTTLNPSQFVYESGNGFQVIWVHASATRTTPFLDVIDGQPFRDRSDEELVRPAVSANHMVLLGISIEATIAISIAARTPDPT
jgi:hypothetical protein